MESEPLPPRDRGVPRLRGPVSLIAANDALSGPEAASMGAAAVAIAAEAVRAFDNAKEINGDFTGVVRTLLLKIFSSPWLNNP